MLEIVKKESLPKGFGANQKGNPKYPFHLLEAGDAFPVKYGDKSPNALQVQLSASCAYYSKSDKKFGTRIDRENGCVWVIRKS